VTGRNVLAAALSPGTRTARVVVSHEHPNRTTAQARAMGITTRVGRYETIYGGDPNRIHNVQLVARLIDGKLIPPGATFSFNRATGARTADKGFREAPVIINGELTTGLGGGVCQVSTTVFNAAYEAGLKITDRTNHALYISHYPQGTRRDRQLPGRRPEVRERHGAVAAAAHLRRLVLADRRSLRRAAAPTCRERDTAARRHRTGAAAASPGPGALRRLHGRRRGR
jgi:Uncharacterized vancomycin resistance protein